VQVRDAAVLEDRHDRVAAERGGPGRHRHHGVLAQQLEQRGHVGAPPVQPSTSRRISTARWRPGSRWMAVRNASSERVVR
jgi:hypothetical protein